MSQEKVIAYIGRFQIFHEGHESTLRHAIQNADRVVVAVGSSNLARDPRNPFTFEERKSVIEAVMDRLAQAEWAKGRTVKFNIVPVNDYVYNNTKWLSEVQKAVTGCTSSTNIFLTGYDKDETTSYLKYFPTWGKEFVPAHLGPHNGPTRDLKVLNASDLRETLFKRKQLPAGIPAETVEFLTKFMQAKEEIFLNLVNEHEFNTNYRDEMNDRLPYASIPFLTGDALVVCSGQVLVVKRRSFPGKGLYALPGGFFDKDKDLSQTDTALRELKEETKIKVPPEVLRGKIVNTMEFGDPARSLRWRIITRCVYIKLDEVDLPKVKGSDDAEKAFWMPLADIVKNRDQFFEDHYSIMSVFLGLD